MDAKYLKSDYVPGKKYEKISMTDGSISAAIDALAKELDPETSYLITTAINRQSRERVNECAKIILEQYNIPLKEATNLIESSKVIFPLILKYAYEKREKRILKKELKEIHDFLDKIDTDEFKAVQIKLVGIRKPERNKNVTLKHKPVMTALNALRKFQDPRTEKKVGRDEGKTIEISIINKVADEIYQQYKDRFENKNQCHKFMAMVFVGAGLIPTETEHYEQSNSNYQDTIRTKIKSFLSPNNL